MNKTLHGNSKNRSRLPVISIFLAAVSLLLYFDIDAGTFLQYDRNSIADGELWRVFTSHWTHWSFEHFLWCTITFVALGYICEEISRRGFVATLVITSCAIPAVLWVTDSGMQMYRGLSGLASAIFVFGALMMMIKALKTRDWPMVFLSATAGSGYIAKILYEYISGSALFVNTHEIFSPVPLVHLTGGAVGMLVALIIITSSHKEPFLSSSSASYA